MIYAISTFHKFLASLKLQFMFLQKGSMIYLFFQIQMSLEVADFLCFHKSYKIYQKIFDRIYQSTKGFQQNQNIFVI